MLKSSQTIIITGLLMMLPVIGIAQTCNRAIIANTSTSRFARYVNGTVLDRYTGLMWKTCSEGQQWNAARKECKGLAHTYTWQQALQLAQTLNIKGGFAAYKDWRVPNIKELFTLIERKCESPAINLQVFPNVASIADPYDGVWSSTPAIYGNFARYVGFGSIGRNFSGGYKLFPYQVRLVRGGQ